MCMYQCLDDMTAFKYECWKIIVVVYRILEFEELMEELFKNEFSEEKSEVYNYSLEIESNSTIGNLIIE